MKLSSNTVGTGSQRTMVLHGFMGSGQNLRSLARRLTQVDPSRSFELVDLTGHGASPPLPPNATLADIARDVIDTAVEVGATEPFDIIGHSLGGRVGLAAALEAPDRVGAVTLLDISPSPTKGTTTGSRGVLDVLLEAPATAESRAAMRAYLKSTRLAPALVEWMLTNLRPAEDGGYRWRLNREALDEAFDRLNSVDLWEVIERRDRPFTCIRGARSRFVSDKDAQRLKDNAVRVITIQGAGHYLHVNALDALVRLLSD